MVLFFLFSFLSYTIIYSIVCVVNTNVCIIRLLLLVGLGLLYMRIPDQGIPGYKPTHIIVLFIGGHLMDVYGSIWLLHILRRFYILGFVG